MTSRNDDLSRITRFDSSQDGISDYTYDVNSQLTAADPATQTAGSYSYDSNGNRTNTGYTRTANNQLASDGTWPAEREASILIRRSLGG